MTSSTATTLSVSTTNQNRERERDQLMEIEKLRKKLEETERAMAQLIAEMNCDRHKAKVSFLNSFNIYHLSSFFFFTLISFSF